jgi:hypothetical protein
MPVAVGCGKGRRWPSGIRLLIHRKSGLQAQAYTDKWRILCRQPQRAEIMKLNASKLFFAVSLAVAIVWLICVALVGLAPGGMMTMSGHMMHSDFNGMSWTLNMTGIVAGLLIWSLSAGALAWLAATIYNFLHKDET